VKHFQWCFSWDASESNHIFQIVSEGVFGSTSLKKVEFSGVWGDFEKNVVMSCTFLGHMKNNYTIESVTTNLCEEHRKREPIRTLLDSVDIICRLNKTGRSYMREDRHCLESATDFLAMISNDPDCIFHHIHDNADVFFGSMAHAIAKNRVNG
jgi:hypothetical protein